MVEPSVGQKRNCVDASAMMVSAAMSSPSSSSSYFDHDPEYEVVPAHPMAKKKKLNHSDVSPPYSSPKKEVIAVTRDEQKVVRPRLPSPTDVRTAPSISLGCCPQLPKKGSQIKMLPPTLKGITDAARILHASKSSNGTGKECRAGKQSATPPLLLSFPTESIYMVACCVKTVSSRSISKLLSRTDSQSSFGSLSSSQGNMESTHPASAIIHPPNSSLEWMLNCNHHSMTPSLFVCDKEHALNFCRFTKPKTFAIRPPSLSANAADGTSLASTSKTCAGNVNMRENSFCPLPIFGGNQAPLTPKTSLGSPTNTGSPVTPSNQKLYAANFSESREAFLRLASKFWPGPVVFHVQVRMLGGEEDVSASLLSKKSFSCSVSSLTGLPNMPDLMGAGNLNPATSADCVPVLPASALIPASRLLPNQEDQESERYFVGIQCPSHPLPRKILNEIYRGPNSSSPTVSHSPSFDSLASISSMDDNIQKASSCKNGRARSSIAVVGCMAPGFKVPINDSINAKPPCVSNAGVTKAADVEKAMAAMVPSTSPQEKHGHVFIVDGEDVRENFSVPTCQYGRPYPVSLVIDGEHRTIHLMRHSHPAAKESTGGAMKERLLTKTSVYRALRTPASPKNGQSFNLSGGPHSQDAVKEKKGDSSSIDRVITAVLSRWTIHESAYVQF